MSDQVIRDNFVTFLSSMSQDEVINLLSVEDEDELKLILEVCENRNEYRIKKCAEYVLVNKPKPKKIDPKTAIRNLKMIAVNLLIKGG